ncbi:DUF6900 domain-containing protein [Facklamia languida]
MTNKEVKRNSFLVAIQRREQKKEIILLEIAKQHSFAVNDRGDLEKRNTDSEDFIELSVWSLKAMLKAAYEAGQQGR